MSKKPLGIDIRHYIKVYNDKKRELQEMTKVYFDLDENYILTQMADIRIRNHFKGIEIFYLPEKIMGARILEGELSNAIDTLYIYLDAEVSDASKN